MQYSYNSSPMKKKQAKKIRQGKMKPRVYHVTTKTGTLCKLENSEYGKYQNTRTDKPPEGMNMCLICAKLLERKNDDFCTDNQPANIGWDENRFANF